MSCGMLDPVMHMNQKLRGSLALLLATLIWGSTVVAQSVGMDYIGPFTFQAIRGGLAVIFLIPVSYLLEKEDERYPEKLIVPGNRCPYFFETHRRNRVVVIIALLLDSENSEGEKYRSENGYDKRNDTV